MTSTAKDRAAQASDGRCNNPRNRSSRPFGRPSVLGDVNVTDDVKHHRAPDESSGRRRHEDKRIGTQRHTARTAPILLLQRLRWWQMLLPWLLAGLLLPQGARAERSFSLDSGDEIVYERWAGGDAARVLLLPADEGFTENEMAFGQALAAEGLDVVYPRLHDSYFLTPGAFSLSAVPTADLVAFLAHIDDGERPLVLVANQRVAVIALQLVDAYQRHVSDRRPAGLVLLSPYLEASAPVPGAPIVFHAAAQRSNLPLALFQPSSSSRMYYLADTIAALESGGSPVYARIEHDTRDAYHIWPEQITAHEAVQRKRLPADIAAVLPLLIASEAAPLPSVSAGAPGARRNTVFALPQAIADMPAAPAFHLTDLNGRAWTVDDLRQHVVLLNFWATWCPPCVEELPALMRLRARMPQADFTIVSIDVGEDQATIERFLHDHGIALGYPVLVDSEGDTVKRWHITGFPTTFITDRRGRLRYGLIGAINWDSDEVVALIEQLLDE